MVLLGFLKMYLFICMSVRAHIWGSESEIWASAVSFQFVCFGVITLVFRLDSVDIELLYAPPLPGFFFFFFF